MNHDLQSQWSVRMPWARLWDESQLLRPYILRVLHVMSEGEELHLPISRVGQEVAGFLMDIGLVRGFWVDEPCRHKVCQLTPAGQQYVAEHPRAAGNLPDSVELALPHNRRLYVDAVDLESDPAALVSAVREAWDSFVADGTAPMKVRKGLLNAAIASSPFTLLAAPEFAQWPAGCSDGLSALFGPARYTFRLSLGCAACGARLPAHHVSWMRFRKSMRPLSIHRRPLAEQGNTDGDLAEPGDPILCHSCLLVHTGDRPLPYHHATTTSCINITNTLHSVGNLIEEDS
jgi:hypothetical protein